MEKDKIIANQGIERNKKPLKNIIYQIEIIKELKGKAKDNPDYDKFKFKDEGYMSYLWWYEQKNALVMIKSFGGFITVDKLKELIGEKQYAKFCQGKRQFIIQRRENGKNKKKNELKNN